MKKFILTFIFCCSLLLPVAAPEAELYKLAATSKKTQLKTIPSRYRTQKNNAGETATDYKAKIISTDIKSIIAAD